MNHHLYERIVSSLLADVRAGRLKPGDRVPSEMELAARFEVSRITSRRALDVLARSNVVERAQGRGTFVARALPDFDRLEATFAHSPVQRGSAPVRSGMVGLVLPDFSDAYGLHLVYAIEEACSRAGLHLSLKRTYGERRVEEDAIAAFQARGLDGLIVFPVHGERYNPVLLKAVLDDFPVVLIDRYLKGIPAHAVVTDNRAASEALTEHLLALGHREIAFVSPPVANTSALEERLEGFNAALVRHGVSLRADRYLSNLFSTLPTQFRPENIAADQKALRRFIGKLPVTAFVCSEYNLALELTQLLESMNERVPESYSIACFDSPQVPLEQPRFTHVRQDETAMGALAVEHLIQRIHGELEPARTNIAFSLVVGRSTAKPRTQQTPERNRG